MMIGSGIERDEIFGLLTVEDRLTDRSIKYKPLHDMLTRTHEPNHIKAFPSQSVI